MKDRYSRRNAIKTTDVVSIGIGSGAIWSSQRFNQIFDPGGAFGNRLDRDYSCGRYIQAVGAMGFRRKPFAEVEL